MAIRARLATVALLCVGAAVVLQGCGCDEEKGKECATTYAAALLTGTDTCKSLETYSSCISDSSCCDYDSGNGVTEKKAIDAAITLQSSSCSDVKNKC